MAEPLTKLPRGRHRLPRVEVARSQRNRLLLGMADAVAANGYAATTVADVLERAGVSRETFYEQFSSKQACFAAAFEAAANVVLAGLGGDEPAAGRPGERLGRALDRYLEGLASNPRDARVFLVEVYAAGPDAVRRRAAWQQRLAAELQGIVGADEPSDRFACEAVVAAASGLATARLFQGGAPAIRALEAPITELAGRLLTPRPGRRPAR